MLKKLFGKKEKKNKKRGFGIAEMAIALVIITAISMSAYAIIESSIRKNNKLSLSRETRTIAQNILEIFKFSNNPEEFMFWVENYYPDYEIYQPGYVLNGTGNTKINEADLDLSSEDLDICLVYKKTDYYDLKIEIHMESGTDTFEAESYVIKDDKIQFIVEYEKEDGF